MKQRRGWLPVVVVGLLVVAGFYVWRSNAATMIEEPRRTAGVGRGTLEKTVIATGVIRPVVGAEINVGSRISGTVVSLPVKVGDRVEAGQLLAELDALALEAALEAARADRLLARAQVTLAESTLERRRRLGESGLASGEDLDIARRDLEVERARLLASEARLRSAEIVLGYTRITAPISGVVAEVTTREGETVAADFSAPTFVTLIDLDRLEVLAYVDETDVGRVSVGQAASFTVDTYPDAKFAAEVIAVQPRAELSGSVVNYVVRLAPQNPRLRHGLRPSPSFQETVLADEDDLLAKPPGHSEELDSSEGYVLRPEMTAHVRLLIDERQGALTAPRAALRRRDGRPYVVVERAGGWVEQEVKTGWRSDSAVEILSGLEEGETLELNPD